jgi:2-amino-4-hydroxy-6-hydroxymethyldihydropteridine diphosphokinase
VDHGYIVGVGTNIEPERNSLAVLDKLAARFGSIIVSRMYYTDPVGMKSLGRFINFSVYVRSHLAPRPFKAVCTGIEIQLGRNRSDPNSKTSDRPADIDLLVEVPCKELATVSAGDNAYLLQPTSEIIAVLLETPVPGAKGELCVIAPLGDTPTTVDHDDRAGLIVIGQDGLNGHPHRFDTSFLLK